MFQDSQGEAGAEWERAGPSQVGINPSTELPQPISRAGHPSLSGAGQASVSLESEFLHPGDALGGMEVTAGAAPENPQLWLLPPKKRFQPHLAQPWSPQGFVALLELPELSCCPFSPSFLPFPPHIVFSLPENPRWIPGIIQQ